MHGEGEEEQNINPFSAALLLPYGYQIFHSHTKATQANVHYLRQFNVKVVVVQRKILDSLVSMREMMNREICKVIPGIVWPRKEWATWDEYHQYRYLVDNAIPWYLSFHYLWRQANIPKLFVKYEEFYADQEAGFEKILRAFTLPVNKKCIKAATKKKVNFFIGKNGRGKEIVPLDLQERIKDMADVWDSGLWDLLK
jgi:hypothetical protein